MRLFLELAKLSFQRQLAYRSAHLAGVVTNLFFGLLRAAVIIALYGERQDVSGLSLQMAITFTGLSQATIGYLTLFSWADIIKSIYSGEVASDLLKPMNFFSFWLAKDLGRAAAAFLMRSVTIMLIYALIFDINYPENLAQWVAVAFALIFSWLISFAWRFLVNLTAFWTPNTFGISRFAYGMSWVLSGFAMPLAFFPSWFQNIADATPFPSMVYTIIEIYLGIASGNEILLLLLGQALWLIILILIAKVMLSAGIRRLVVLGG
jgi:ABC-2 type transport system permease protein